MNAKKTEAGENAGKANRPETLQPPVSLSLGRSERWADLKFQRLRVDLLRPDRRAEPSDLSTLQLPPGVDTSGGVVLEGRAPIWLHAFLVRELQPTAWVACFDPRLGAVVVAAHSRQVQVGQVIPIAAEMAAVRPPGSLGPALMVVGPPDSGKSVLAHALFQALLPEEPGTFLQRANWDGEGNYILETDRWTDAEREEFKARNRGCLTPEFFPRQAEAILALRRRQALTIVDVGGMVQPEKLPVLEACSHYLIVSSDPAATDEWHEFCRDRGNLRPVAVVLSTLEPCETVTQQQPVLELTCGPWIRGRSRAVPVPLLQRVRELL